jgi:hypothetical protein
MKIPHTFRIPHITPPWEGQGGGNNNKNRPKKIIQNNKMANILLFGQSPFGDFGVFTQNSQSWRVILNGCIWLRRFLRLKIIL